eukprot:688345-Amorphochlora_amoeboformis.AAC.1
MLAFRQRLSTSSRRCLGSGASCSVKSRKHIETGRRVFLDVICERGTDSRLRAFRLGFPPWPRAQTSPGIPGDP